MPIDLNTDHDIHMVDGRLVTNSGKESISQDILTRLNMFLGEWQLNINDGTPWFQVVFHKPFSFKRAESVIKSRILSTVGVAKLTSFHMHYDSAVTRKLTVTFSAVTVEGESIYINELGVPNA